MDITPLFPKGRQPIAAYGNGGFKIGEHSIQGSVLITGEQVLAWSVNLVDAISQESLTAMLGEYSKPEILLIGTGKTLAHINPSLRQVFRSQGISIDVMDTGAACRTYNVLLAEDRKVYAALIAV